MSGMSGAPSIQSTRSHALRPVWTRDRFAALLVLNVNRYAVFYLYNGVIIKGMIRGTVDATADLSIVQFNFEMDQHVGPLVIRPEDLIGVFISTNQETAGRNLMDSLDELSVSSDLLGVASGSAHARALGAGAKVSMSKESSADPIRDRDKEEVLKKMGLREGDEE